MPRPLLLLLIALIGLSAQLHAEPSRDIKLPEMGDSSATLFSQAQERLIGLSAMQQMRRSGRVVTDPLLDSYIRELGTSLVAALQEESDSFTFFLVNDLTINAFAMPGGYIGVHTGLLLASRSESELASVLAHEIAHVTQHHLARSYEQASRLNLPMTAAVIAALLLSGSDPQLTQAALYSTMAGRAQLSLNFTRTNEREADRVGIQLLAQSGHDPNAMASFFARMQEEQRYRGAPPEFLSTHPVTLDRIAEAEQRAIEYSRRATPSSLNYRLLKARLQINSKQSPFQASPGNEIGSDPVERYRYALALQQSGKLVSAVNTLKELQHHEPTRIIYTVTLAEALREQKQDQRAEALLNEGLKLTPNNPILVSALAQLKIDQGSGEEAAQLLRTLTPRWGNPIPSLLDQLAQAEDLRGDKSAAAIAQSDYRIARGELHHAQELLQQLQRTQSRDDYYQPLIEVRLEEIDTQLKKRAELEIE